MPLVMGPSGAGKSTFLDVLSRRSHATEGTVSKSPLCIQLQNLTLFQITVNGSEAADMRALSAYVEQDDALLGVLSVKETIQFAARLRYVLCHQTCLRFM